MSCRTYEQPERRRRYEFAILTAKPPLYRSDIRLTLDLKTSALRVSLETVSCLSESWSAMNPEKRGARELPRVVFSKVLAIPSTKSFTKLSSISYPLRPTAELSSMAKQTSISHALAPVAQRSTTNRDPKTHVFIFDPNDTEGCRKKSGLLRRAPLELGLRYTFGEQTVPAIYMRLKLDFEVRESGGDF